MLIILKITGSASLLYASECPIKIDRFLEISRNKQTYVLFTLQKRKKIEIVFFLPYPYLAH